MATYKAIPTTNPALPRFRVQLDASECQALGSDRAALAFEIELDLSNLMTQYREALLSPSDRTEALAGALVVERAHATPTYDVASGLWWRNGDPCDALAPWHRGPSHAALACGVTLADCNQIDSMEGVPRVECCRTCLELAGL